MMHTFRFTSGEQDIFRRRPYTPLSVWASENIIVKDGPYAGSRFRLDVNPYLAGIMDTWSDPQVEETDICGSAQTGKTSILHCAIAYCVDMRPGPRMLAMQDDDTISKVMTAKLLPLLKASPAIRGKLGKVRSSYIAFHDGTGLFLASAMSPGQRASISIQDLFLDEEALYKQISGQGVPVAEFIERTRSYSDKRKILRVSKPIGGEESSILLALSECDEVRQYHVRCPACGTYQVMTEQGLTLAEKTSNPQEVERRRLGRYRCVRCSYLWSDHIRDQAVQHGRWMSENPVPRPRRVGFHLPAILSKAVSISEVVATKMRAEASDAPAVRQQYDNGIWARAYKEVQLETSEEQILSRIDPDLPARTVPGDAVALTAGIDVQARGFWFVVLAWRPDKSSALIDYGRLTDWDSVGAPLETRYPFEADSPRAGQSLAIWRAGIDSGGTRTDEAVVSRTEEVYSFVRRHGENRLFACKGASRESYAPVRATSIDRMPSSKIRIPGGLWLYLLDTGYFKSLLFSRLQEDARQPFTLNRETDQSFALQMTAETLERGRDGKMVWVRHHKNNHYIDCCMMASACVDDAWLPSFSLILEAEMQARAVAKGSHRQVDSADGIKPPHSPRMERNLPQRRGSYTY